MHVYIYNTYIIYIKYFYFPCTMYCIYVFMYIYIYIHHYLHVNMLHTAVYRFAHVERHQVFEKNLEVNGEKRRNALFGRSCYAS